MSKDNVKYILNGAGEVVETTDLLEWGTWFETSGKQRSVAYDQVGDYRISTVFLGIDHSFGVSVEPVLFETMVFYDVEKNNLGKAKIAFGNQKYDFAIDGFQQRYHTKDEALSNHRKIVRSIKRELDKK